MREYRCASDDEHVNATILGHAYHLFVHEAGRRLLPTASLADRVKRGHEVAGDVLTYIPYALPTVPRFIDVAFWFAQRSQELYGPAVRDAAINAFRTQAGIGTQTPAGQGCIPSPSPPSAQLCATKNPTPPECLTQSPPTRPELEETE